MQADRRVRAPTIFSPIDALLLLVAIIWGGSYSAAKVATGQMMVLQFLVLRFGLTFLLLLPALRGLAVPGWRPALVGASGLGLNLLAIFVCETFGVSLTTASNAAFFDQPVRGLHAAVRMDVAEDPTQRRHAGSGRPVLVRRRAAGLPAWRGHGPQCR